MERVPWTAPMPLWLHHIHRQCRLGKAEWVSESGKLRRVNVTDLIAAKFPALHDIERVWVMYRERRPER